MLVVIRSLENILTYLTGLSIAVMMFLTTADAAGRYLFNHPVLGAYEITEKYLMALAFLGICYAYHKGAYIRLTFLVDHMPHRVEMGMNYFVQIICVALTLAFTIATFQQIFYVADSKTVINISGLWTLPLWPAYAIIPLGLFSAFLAMSLDLWRVRMGKSDLFRKEDSSPQDHSDNH